MFPSINKKNAATARKSVFMPEPGIRDQENGERKQEVEFQEIFQKSRNKSDININGDRKKKERQKTKHFRPQLALTKEEQECLWHCQFVEALKTPGTVEYCSAQSIEIMEQDLKKYCEKNEETEEALRKLTQSMSKEELNASACYKKLEQENEYNKQIIKILNQTLISRQEEKRRAREEPKEQKEARQAEYEARMKAKRDSKKLLRQKPEKESKISKITSSNTGKRVLWGLGAAVGITGIICLIGYFEANGVDTKLINVERRA